jgi:hypothetical protein
MSWTACSPLFPSLTPRPADPLRFSVDKPVNAEEELGREEAEHTAAMLRIAQQGSDLTPIGKTSTETFEENEDEEDEDEDSESDHEEEEDEDVDMGNNFDQEDHNNQN